MKRDFSGPKNGRRLTLIWVIVLLLSTLACRLPSIGRIMGDLPNTLKNMFQNVAGKIGF